MARQILGNDDRQRREAGTRPEARLQRSSRQAGATKLLTAARSTRYLAALRTLDASGNQLAPVDREALTDAIMAEFPPVVTLPDGAMSRCYLGEPYEVHLLDIGAGFILEHYERGRNLDATRSAARKLLQHGSYEIIELYRDRLVCLRADGTATEVPR